jgi:TRAP-type uncharacterized transport system substrate-binding protein
MKMGRSQNLFTVALVAATLMGLGSIFASAASAAPLVLGSGDADSATFTLGNKLVKAIALDLDGITVNSRVTKGDKDNVKLLGKKKRGVDLGFATLGAATKAWNAEGKKQNRKFKGLLAIAKNKMGKTLYLLAGKKVKKDQAKAIVQYLLSAKGKKRLKKLKADASPASGAAEFKAAGIPLHAGAM